MLRGYRELKVWQKSMDLAEESYRLTAAFPKHELYGLTSQLKRAAVSVAANIAEGHGREHLGDYIHHLSISMGSLSECDTLVEIGHRRGFVEIERAKHNIDSINREGRILSGLIAALKRRR